MFFLSIKKTILIVFATTIFGFSSDATNVWKHNPYDLKNPITMILLPGIYSPCSPESGQDLSTSGRASEASVQTPSLSATDHQNNVLQNQIFELLKFESANWDDHRFLNLHQYVSTAILEDRITNDQFISIPPEKCKNLCLPLKNGVSYPHFFIDSYKKMISAIENLTGRLERKRVERRQLTLETQLLINQIAERFYLTISNTRNLLLSKISIANLYRLMRQNKNAFKKGYKNIQFATSSNLHDKIGAILFGMATSFYHSMKNELDIRNKPQNERRDICEKMYEALCHHHHHILPTEKSRDCFDVLRFVGFQWIEDSRSLIWSGKEFQTKFLDQENTPIC